MRHQTRRSVIAVGSVAVLCGFTVLAGTAGALPAKGIKGDPQPELKPFTLGASFSTGGGAVAMSNGNIVSTWDVDDSGKTYVCVLARAKTSCSIKVTLSPYSGDTAIGTPAIFSPAPNHVVILQPADGDDNVNGDDVLYSSTNGGASFTALGRVGSLSNDASALIDGNIVFGTSGHDGTEIESIADDATTPSPVAFLTPGEDATYAMSIGSYKNGALVSSQTGSGATTVQYAPAGQPLGVAASYHSVGTFPNEDILGMSGSALLTEQQTGKSHIVLRLFNGTKYGAAHILPGDDVSGGPASAVVNQDAGGETHVFNIMARKDYHLFEQSTYTGSSWTAATDLGNAIKSSYFSEGLDAGGSGIVLGVGLTHSTAIAYPVLEPQLVTFALKKSSVTEGHKTTGKGVGILAASGRKIDLQVEKKHRWYDVAATHESHTGKFSFTIKGSKVGSFPYRAVASDKAGYVEFGYSAAHTLHVKAKPKHR